MLFNSQFRFTQYLSVLICIEVYLTQTQLEIVRLEFNGNYEICNEDLLNLTELSLQIWSWAYIGKFERLHFSMEVEIYLFIL